MKNGFGRNLLSGICMSVATAGTALVTSSTQAWAMDTPGVNTSVANSVTVTGVGTVTIEAPLVQLTVGMNFSDSSVQDVVKDMNIVKQKVTSVLKKFPIGDVVLSTPQLNGGNTPNGQVSLLINMPNTSQVTGILEALLSINAPYIQSTWTNTQYVPQDITTTRAKLFKAALADAYAQAETLAAEEGDSVGRVISMTTTPVNGVVNYQPTPYAAGSGAGAIAGGGVQWAYNGYNSSFMSLSSQVTVTYQLLDGK